MKILTFIGLGILLSITSNPKTSWEKESLNGAVKRQVARVYQLSGSVRTPQKENLVEKEIATYNSKGYKTGGRLFNDETNLVSLFTYKYDENNNEIEYTSSDKDYELEERYTSVYDQDGNLIDMRIYNRKGNLKYRWAYQYNAKGELIKKVKYDRHSEQVFKRNIQNYSDRKITTTYDPEGNLLAKVVRLYDDHEREIQKTLMNSEGNIDRKSIKVYNDRGFLISDEDINYLRDQHIKMTMEYELDKKGNWIQMLSIVEDMKSNKKVPLRIIEREIVYF